MSTIHNVTYRAKRAEAKALILSLYDKNNGVYTQQGPIYVFADGTEFKEQSKILLDEALQDRNGN